MKKISALIIIFFLVLSCGNKEVKKESKEFKEPVLEETIVKKDEVSEEIIKEVNTLVFTVQIAALKKNNTTLINVHDVKKYDENSLTKYRLGSFLTYKEARSFRKSILKLYPDAFIQALKNDKPISIKEALN